MVSLSNHGQNIRGKERKSETSSSVWLDKCESCWIWAVTSTSTGSLFNTLSCYFVDPALGFVEREKRCLKTGHSLVLCHFSWRLTSTSLLMSSVAVAEEHPSPRPSSALPSCTGPAWASASALCLPRPARSSFLIRYTRSSPTCGPSLIGR